MAVLERSELEASPLADLHAIADQIGLEGFRRLRKAELIDAILGEEGPAATAPDAAAGPGDADADLSDRDGGQADGADRDSGEEREGRGGRLRRRRSRRGSGSRSGSA